ncbi:hypothetical protein I4F81_006593 [Pyropia yezoensis]|uniref:Uncharacterized protein n=1 Tax=Pyropia yezoensis TaxID=2788 RepID=A0ACC3C2F8_PYRYE|nr:hypothetical protein I4F81_006593 [Neopyropia yezoensis]
MPLSPFAHRTFPCHRCRLARHRNCRDRDGCPHRRRCRRDNSRRRRHLRHCGGRVCCLMVRHCRRVIWPLNRGALRILVGRVSRHSVGYVRCGRRIDTCRPIWRGRRLRGGGAGHLGTGP